MSFVNTDHPFSSILYDLYQIILWTLTFMLEWSWSLNSREAQRKPLLLVQNSLSQNHVCSSNKSLPALHRHLQHVAVELQHVPVLDLQRKRQIWEENDVRMRHTDPHQLLWRQSELPITDEDVFLSPVHWMWDCHCCGPLSSSSWSCLVGRVSVAWPHKHQDTSR